MGNEERPHALARTDNFETWCTRTKELLEPFKPCINTQLNPFRDLITAIELRYLDVKKT